MPYKGNKLNNPAPTITNIQFLKCIHVYILYHCLYRLKLSFDLAIFGFTGSDKKAILKVPNYSSVMEGGALASRSQHAKVLLPFCYGCVIGLF